MNINRDAATGFLVAFFWWVPMVVALALWGMLA
jgi:hypothetical protein